METVAEQIEQRITRLGEQFRKGPAAMLAVADQCKDKAFGDLLREAAREQAASFEVCLAELRNHMLIELQLLAKIDELMHENAALSGGALVN